MTTPPAKASTLRDLRHVCRPQPLGGEELKTFFVETYAARNPHQHTRRLLHEALAAGADQRILFYGHRGCGKSTELNKLLVELGDRFEAVPFSIEQHMTMTAAVAEDLLLLICERVLHHAATQKLPVDDGILQPVYNYFAATERRDTVGSGETASLAAGAEVKTPGFLGGLVKLFARFKGEIQYDAHSSETRVAVLRKRPADLVAQTNAVLAAVTDCLPEGKKLLVVVEDLDKLDLARARPMFVDNISLLAGVHTNIIYTVPVFLFHSPDVGQFRPHFDHVFALPMIKVREPGKTTTLPAGFQTVKDIVHARLDERLLEDDALALLVRETGGVLRHVFQVLAVAATITDVAPPLKDHHIAYGLQQLAKEFWSQVSLPHDAAAIPGCPQDVEVLYERLAECARAEDAGRPNPCKADATNQILLRSCALVEYNGEGWLGVHPVVRTNLQRMGRLDRT
jgi:energy-coupling factor transporter ATP-binding protein EcfA2